MSCSTTEQAAPSSKILFSTTENIKLDVGWIGSLHFLDAWTG